MSFWDKAKASAVKKEIYRNRIQAKLGHPDMKIEHPDWVRDAQEGKYTVMDTKVKDKILKRQKRAKERQDRLG